MLVAVISLSPAAAVQRPSCDPELRPSRGPLGYRARGQRCEGSFARPVAGSALVPVSLTTTFRYDTAAPEPLVISLPEDTRDTVQLVARSTRTSVYYQMDAQVAPGGGPFTWPTDVLSAMRLRADAIGVLATTREQVGRDQVPVHLAVRVAQAGSAAAACDTVRLALWPGSSADSVTVMLAATGAGGRRQVLRADEELGREYYPAARRIDVPLPEVRDSGLYWVRATAWRAGARNPLELYLRRPEPARCGR